MDSYLVDETTLGEFVDTLLEQKYPDDPKDAHADVRTEAIKALDHKILKAIFGQLTPDEGAELNKLLDENDSDTTVFEDFFRNNSVDLEKTITNVMVDFKEDFLRGGNNE